jgi:cellulose synthase/poly-beta-1,6-N-acetylglucosamine synthase-like glycosyltransferase
MLKMKVKGSGYTSDDVNRKENRVPKEEVSMLPDLTIPPTTLPIDVKATATQRGTEPVVKRDNWPDQTTKDPKVGVSMIVKNEGKVLRRCLESVKDHVDEIVIVDTGSTDDTINGCCKLTVMRSYRLVMVRKLEMLYDLHIKLQLI